MRVVDIITKKRDGGKLNSQEIYYLVHGFAQGEIPDYQIASLLMAIFFQSLDFEETQLLTQAMIESGERYIYPEIKSKLSDKHSTGGVGDKLSLILAPIAASAGCFIPMMSGRGLGHTGGTLDKLEAIPGYNVFPNKARADEILKECGFVMMGQTDSIVPADKLLYALRDVTGTVESVPLITASIMSKKIAEGAQSLVIDLKCGSGAFMKNLENARKLAEFMNGVGKQAGVDMKLLITDMDTPLGDNIGNYDEALESYHALLGYGDERMMELVYRLAGWMMVLSGVAANIDEAVIRAAQTVRDGTAAALFLKNIEMQGGDTRVLIEPQKNFAHQVSVRAERSGYISKMDALKLGLASMHIGCGRKTKEDSVDHFAGISIMKKLGSRVEIGDEIFTLRYNQGNIEEAIRLSKDSLDFSDKEPIIASLLFEELD